MKRGGENRKSQPLCAPRTIGSIGRGIGFNLVTAISAPYDEPNPGRSGAA
jgi:hypothetical protein